MVSVYAPQESEDDRIVRKCAVESVQDVGRIAQRLGELSKYTSGASEARRKLVRTAQSEAEGLHRTLEALTG